MRFRHRLSDKESRNGLRIAVIGCGAISRSFHLPALSKYPGVMRRLLLVDVVEARARDLALEYGVTATAPDPFAALGRVDGAIIAVPPEHHAELALAFLQAGVPVLVEKPLATSVEEARRLVEASRSTGVPIAVNNNRRLFPALRKVTELITAGTVGGLRRIEIYDGYPLDWPLVSGGAFGLGGTGRGVLEDLGAHDLDLLCWWLGETPRLRRYADDSRGGSEAVARLEFETDECEGIVHLSWLSDLENAFTVEGEAAHVRGQIRAWDHISIRNAGEARWGKVRLRPAVPDFLSVRDAVIGGFLDLLGGSSPPIASAEDVLPSIELIERCYQSREVFEVPWFELPEGARNALR